MWYNGFFSLLFIPAEGEGDPSQFQVTADFELPEFSSISHMEDLSRDSDVQSPRKASRLDAADNSRDPQSSENVRVKGGLGELEEIVIKEEVQEDDDAEGDSDFCFTGESFVGNQEPYPASLSLAGTSEQVHKIPIVSFMFDILKLWVTVDDVVHHLITWAVADGHVHSARACWRCITTRVGIFHVVLHLVHSHTRGSQEA